jgi:tRNA 2-thiouridine synthesizing protein A
MSRHQLDAQNLLCPMPVIRAQDAVAELKAGDILEVVCTDHGALQDIPAWCRINGHKVVDTRDLGREVIITIEVGQSD